MQTLLGKTYDETIGCTGSSGVTASATAVNWNIGLQPKQWKCLEAILDRRPNAPRVIGFGGSRGCAKTGGVRRIYVTLATQIPGVIIWVIRRVWDDLNKDHVKPLWVEFPELKDRYRAQDKEIQFDNGSSIFFIHAGDTGRAKRKARGPQAHYIFVEQAEEFSQEEIEQLKGSNRAPGTPQGFCKRILTFNPGGIGTNYLRRIFNQQKYLDNEDPSEFLFIQGYGWDNYEWFRGVPGIVSEQDFYHAPEWNQEEVFEWQGHTITACKRKFLCFVEKTDFGNNLATQPRHLRIGELLGSFEQFAGQYYSDVWEESSIVLKPDTVCQLMKPWWRRWISTDWGFSHYASTGWFGTGVLSPEECAAIFNVQTDGPVRVIIRYRELVCNDVPEPDLAQVIVTMTPDGERREVRSHYIGHDAWAKRGSANTVVDQMDPILRRGGLQQLEKADIDRIGGWRLLYNCFAATRRFVKCQGLYKQQPDEAPILFISGACVETTQAIPMLICDDDNPKDVRKIPGEASDDIADELRYGIKSFVAADPKLPDEITAERTFHSYQDPTARAMAMLRLTSEQQSAQYIRRRRRA